MRVLVRILSYLKPYRLHALAAFLSLLAITGFNVATPLILRWAIDSGITSGEPSVLRTAALALIGLTLVKSVFAFLQNYLSEIAAQGVARDLRAAIYDHLQHMSFSFHDQAQTGQLMTRATSDVEVLRMFTGRAFINLLNICVLVVSVAAILLWLNWQLALVSLAFLPWLLWTANRFSRTFRPISMEIQQLLAGLTTLLQENLAGVRIVKAFAREPEQIVTFDRENQLLLDKNLDAARLQRRTIPLMDLIASLTTVAVIWFGGTLVALGTLSLGDLVAFNTYLALLVMPIRRLGFLISAVSRAMASGDRIFEVLDLESEVSDKVGATPLTGVSGRVEFDRVTFGYRGLEPALSEVSFSVEPGQTIALLGATGSGKTTIVNLLPRFYDATRGAIRIDGHDIRDVTLDSLRRQIGMVLQESVLFSGTIRENIAYGRPDADLQTVVDAAKVARANDFIASFPDGYDTVVGERGVTLSGGQKQRLAIARAVLLDPCILILDDSTSSVDLETERLIQDALGELMKGRTTFVIAQRLSTIRQADQIIVLDHGRIAARGTHEELLEGSGIYADLYNVQARAERAGTAVASARPSTADDASAAIKPANRPDMAAQLPAGGVGRRADVEDTR